MSQKPEVAQPKDETTKQVSGTDTSNGLERAPITSPADQAIYIVAMQAGRESPPKQSANDLRSAQQLPSFGEAA